MQNGVKNKMKKKKILDNLFEDDIQKNKYCVFYSKQRIKFCGKEYYFFEEIELFNTLKEAKQFSKTCKYYEIRGKK